jgi:Rrf2 family protein
MKLSTRSRYGLRAIIHLANKRCCCSTRDVSHETHVPYEYLEKIFSRLHKADIIDVKHGVDGGYYLSEPPKNISVGKIIRTLEGSLSPVACTGDSPPCPLRFRCTTRPVWDRIESAITKTLNSMTLETILTRS